MTQDEIVERNVFKVALFIDAWHEWREYYDNEYWTTHGGPGPTL